MRQEAGSKEEATQRGSAKGKLAGRSKRVRRRPGVVPTIDGAACVERWFATRGWIPWEFQREAWDAFARGESGLIQVATGAGKTYGAYMGALAALVDEVREAGTAVKGLRVLYVTPLRAVSRDIELALKQPIEEMDLPISVESRTGDTAASVRARQREELPNVLVTTPESLSLLLTRENARELFASVRAVIVDEWHELLSSKRGTQVELAMARLRRVSPALRAWGLSATLPNLEEAASALVGVGRTPAVIRGDMPRPVLIDSVVPRIATRLPWAGHLGLVMLPDVVEALDPRVATLVFTNTRSQAERWYNAILVAKPEWAGVMALHHGSIDRGERERVEAGLKDGSIRIVVATSSLDLGVDFTPVERVFQIGSPKGIARLVQRAGRSSHQPKAACRVTCVPTHLLELVEIEAARSALAAGQIEARQPQDKPLDVLAQHLVTCALGGGFDPRELFKEVRTAYSYRSLTFEEFEWCLALVKHGGGTLSAYPAYHRVKDEAGLHRVQDKRLAQLHRLNVGTIVSDTTLEVAFKSGRSLGRIEESFIAGLLAGQKFVFAGRVVEFVEMRDLTAIVKPSSGATTYTPIWGGTKLPISESLATGIRKTLERAAGGEFESPEMRQAQPLFDVQTRESVVPKEGETLFEVTRTREGWHLFVFPFDGRGVHGGLATLLAWRLAKKRKATFSIAVNDYGLEILSAEEFAFAELLESELFSREGLVEDVVASMNSSQLARLQFREVARVSGLVFSNYPGTKKTGRQVQASAGLLFDVLNEFDPQNMLLEQARREVLERHFEQGRLGRAMDRVRASVWRIVRTRFATPLSFPLLLERQAAKLSTQSIAERMEAMRAAWEASESSFTFRTAAGSSRSTVMVRPKGKIDEEFVDPLPPIVEVPTRVNRWQPGKTKRAWRRPRL